MSVSGRAPEILKSNQQRRHSMTPAELAHCYESLSQLNDSEIRKLAELYSVIRSDESFTRVVAIERLAGKGIAAI